LTRNNGVHHTSLWHSLGKMTENNTNFKEKKLVGVASKLV
jgi:hypothetical protein